MESGVISAKTEGARHIIMSRYSMSMYTCIYSIHNLAGQQTDMRIFGRHYHTDNPEDKKVSRQKPLTDCCMPLVFALRFGRCLAACQVCASDRIESLPEPSETVDGMYTGHILEPHRPKDHGRYRGIMHPKRRKYKAFICNKQLRRSR